MHRPGGSSSASCAFAAALVIALAACSGSSSPSPTSPSPTPAATPTLQPPRIDPATLKPTASYTIGFSALRDNRTPFATLEESGLTVTAVSGDWISLTTYGNPQPFIMFNGPPGATVTGEVRVTAADAPFWVTSIDFYSSTTKIPYVLEGLLNAEPAFTVVDVIGNTFGAFARRPNPNADVPIQELRIRLSNPSAPCCGNPMGIDNIVIQR